MSVSKPFAKYEWQLALAYLRAKKRDGGISIMTIISFFGITLAVFALIVTLAVRSGFRYEFLQTILGANSHVTIYNPSYISEHGAKSRLIKNYDELVHRISSIEKINLVSPIIKSQVMATANDKNVGVQILGIRSKDLLEIPLIANPKIGIGDISNFRAGIALGSGIARELQVMPGDPIKLISPNGLKTVFGTVPKVEIFEVIYIFEVGRYDIDNTRIYMPLSQAQIYFNKSNGVDEIEVFVSEPDNVDEVVTELKSLVNPGSLFWTWKDRSGAFLNALKVEDNVMFVILSILVLIASLNIVSGLIMLVKNKGKDIGILRTIGLTQGSILRIFFICGAVVGVLGTICGVSIGCIFIINIDPIFNIISDLRGADVWDPSVRYLSKLPARLELSDILLASSLSITLSFVVTFFPARRAAKLNPVEALRDE